jgi:phosphate starvation-inducible PhoH-like protein
LKQRRESVVPQTLEIELLPEDNQRLAALCGPLDQNLRLVEQRLGVEVRRRGNQFRINGSASAGAAQVLRTCSRSPTAATPWTFPTCIWRCASTR